MNSDILWTIYKFEERITKLIDRLQELQFSWEIAHKQSVMDQIKIYFTDSINLPIVRLTDWTLVLTFDFIEDKEKSPAKTSKRAR